MRDGLLNALYESGHFTIGAFSLAFLINVTDGLRPANPILSNPGTGAAAIKSP